MSYEGNPCKHCGCTEKYTSGNCAPCTRKRSLGKYVPVNRAPCSYDGCRLISSKGKKGLCGIHYAMERRNSLGGDRRTAAARAQVGISTQRRDFTGISVGYIKIVECNEDGTWNCECECGAKFSRTHEKISSSVNRQSAATCGNCNAGQVRGPKPAKKHREGPSRQDLSKYIFKHYKKDALKRRYPFDLDETAVEALIFQPCKYCGLLEDKSKFGFWFVGIDRVENLVGYTLENVVPCCTDCNFAKRAMKYKDWIAFLTRITNFRTKPAVSSRKRPPAVESLPLFEDTDAVNDIS